MEETNTMLNFYNINNTGNMFCFIVKTFNFWVGNVE